MKKYLMSIPITSGLIFAQIIPDADSIQRDIQKNIEKIETDNIKDTVKNKLSDVKPLLEDDNISASKQTETEMKFVLKSVHFSGNTVITTNEINQKIESFLNKEVSFSELKNITNVIQRVYSDKGFVAKAYFPKQKIHDGIVDVIILEGKIGEINKNLSSTSKISQETLQKYFQNSFENETMLNTIKLAKVVKLINEQDGLDVKSSMGKGINDELINISLKADLKQKYTFSTNFDNYGSKSLGIIQNNTSFGVVDIFDNGLHDKTTFSTMLSSGNRMGSFNYKAPVGFDGLKLGFSFSKLSYELGDEFKALEIEGSSLTKGLNGSYPLQREDASNIDLLINYDIKNSSSTTKGTETSNKETKLFKTSVNIANEDNFFKGGNNSINLSYTKGSLNIKNSAEKTADSLSAGTDGSFSKMELSFTRDQKIDNQLSLSFNFNGQKAFDNLNSGDKISLGGPSSIRAYPNSEISGDDGYFYNIDLKQKLPNNFTASVFYDYGWVKRNHQTWSTDTSTLPRNISLNGIGVGVSYDHQNGFGAKMEVGKKLSSNDAQDVNGNDSDGTNDKYRIWLSARYNF